MLYFVNNTPKPLPLMHGDSTFVQGTREFPLSLELDTAQAAVIPPVRVTTVPEEISLAREISLGLSK
jgi:hypothetical protein